MSETVPAVIDAQGNVRLLAPVHLSEARRALVVILDEAPATPEASGAPDSLSDVGTKPNVAAAAGGSLSDVRTAQASRPSADDWRLRYELVREIGGGGMGETYEALDRVTGRAVCVKRLKPGIDARALEQECRALGRLAHPAIARLTHFHTTGDAPYLATELVRGPTLTAYLKERRPVAAPVAVFLAERLFDAVAHAHEQDVLHCDLKPGNVLLELRGVDLAPKIVDLGLAVVDRRDDRDIITGAGRMAGTPQYMAPEQIDGAVLSGACDVYALGQILWEMVMGRPAFSGPPMSVFAAKAKRAGGLEIERPPLPVASDLAALVRRCTHPDPGRRPTAGEARDALRGLLPRVTRPEVLAPLNLGFDWPAPDGAPPGWFDSQGFVARVSAAYERTCAPREYGQGGRSLRLRDAGASDREFGSVMQRCPAAHLASREVRFQGKSGPKV